MTDNGGLQHSIEHSLEILNFQLEWKLEVNQSSKLSSYVTNPQEKYDY